ncbi:MAG: hypothetical protein WCH01_00990 [Methylococcaceae bacterium]
MLVTEITQDEMVVDALSKIDQIDLSPINKKLMFDAPEIWTAKRIQEAEITYRRFLAMHLIYPYEILVPNKILDRYWHQHILDTQKYAKDCQKVFGFFLHHDPYFGIGGDEDRKRNSDAFAKTQQLWNKSFSTPLLGPSNPCSSTDCR